MTAAQRRRAVDPLKIRRYSERRACRLVGLSRSVAQYRLLGRDDAGLRAQLKALAEQYPENGMSWLSSSPLIEMEQGPARKPYPLSWEEQDRLFRELPAHLQRMALYKVNTGCREQEVCQLRWEWEVKVPELATSLFILPATTSSRPRSARSASWC